MGFTPPTQAKLNDPWSLTEEDVPCKAALVCTRNGKVRDCAEKSGISLVIPDLPVFPPVIPDLRVILDLGPGSHFSLCNPGLFGLLLACCRTFFRSLRVFYAPNVPLLLLLNGFSLCVPFALFGQYS
jgi:hypothetical protein